MRMRKPLVGGAFFSHLLSARLRRQPPNRMQLLLRKRRSKQFSRCWERTRQALDPDLVVLWVAPVSEDADAVSACHDGVEVASQLVEGDSDVDVLLDGEGWLDGECDLGDDAESAETDEDSGEVWVVAREVH